MRARRHVVIVLCALSTSGCYPVFHAVPDTPAITGRVTQHGRPASDAMVRLYNNDPVLSDKDRSVTARTDSTGRFGIGPIKVFRYFAGVAGDAGTDWRLEFVVDGVQYQGWQNRSLEAPPGLMDVDCEIDDPVKSGNLGPNSSGEGFCRIASKRN